MSKSKALGKLKGLYFILNVGAGCNREIPLWLEGVIANGARIIQVRGKDIHPAKLESLVRQVVGISEKYDALVIVNDHPDIALKSGADGVHLGLEDQNIQEVRKIAGNKLIIGATVRNPDQARKAIKAGADYVAIGAMYKSSTKPGVRVIGPESLAELRNALLEIPICAIGGVNLTNIAELIKAGADMVAVVSCIAESDNPEKTAIGLQTAFGIKTFQKLEEEYMEIDLDD